MYKYNGGTNSAPADALRMMYLYGVGDHGGGPTRKILTPRCAGRNLTSFIPSCSSPTATDFFADTQAARERTEAADVGWRALLPVPPRRANHAVGDQARQSQE